ncbi:DUF192 domain-containing protein [Bordetella sp. FB-8]|uniref:DUF192 domain-containing protein n=1 Tax=Bordetella sp. FB-8 TaxID=1159870 RepID=UPI000379E7BE|nr:DUF192 domain-containing protein [Bordetella sp. FB-8]
MPSFAKHRFAVHQGLLAATLLAASLAATAARAQQSAPQAPLPIVGLEAGIQVIHAEVASTESERERGLMFRSNLPGNDGMLFVFEAPAKQCFWMHNTPLPLSIAFMDDHGVIVNIEDMAAETDDSHCSLKPVRYALEMAQGWFAAKGIKAGDKIEKLP